MGPPSAITAEEAAAQGQTEAAAIHFAFARRDPRQLAKL